MRKCMASGALLSLVLLGGLTFVLAEPASAAVPGLQRVVGSRTSNSVSPTSASATCPAGKRVIGTGAQISGGQGQVVIDDITPNAALTSVTVTGYEDVDGFAGNWTVIAYAVCANPLPGLQRVPFTEGPDSERIKTPSGQCPGSKRTIGIGAAMTGARGRATFSAMVTASGFRNTFAQAFEQQAGTNASWSITVYLICADTTLPGQLLVSDATVFDSQPKGITTGCPSTKVVGPGFSLVQGNGQVVLTDMVPNSTLTTVHAAAVEDQDGQSGVWTVRAFASCATA
jgi:hypothetical protein